MSNYTLDTSSMNSDADYIKDQPKALLATKTGELAGLRFSILLTAKWETAEMLGADRRAELRAQLSNLRSRYFDKMDEIAMAFGVQKAIEAKEKVENEVELPDDMIPSVMPNEPERLFS